MSRSIRGGLVAMAVAGVAAAGQGTAQPRQEPTAKVAQGTLSGIREGDVEAFLGIPYAAPPVGANRWRAPQPLAAWAGTRAATSFGANCIQPRGQGNYGPWTHEYVVTENFSEDCLFLNVWKPERPTQNEKLPVLFWIHGGGFSSGSAAVPIYDGRNLATKGIIVVSVNYRVGPLGFLALPELTREAGREAVSNFGIQDQIAALKWVRDNISAFGGDPAKVTIVGQSAGGMSVHTLVASPAARGLFHQAIAQSGLPLPAMTPDLADAEKTGTDYMKSLGANTLADLRKLPAEQLLPKPGGPPLRFSVVVDKRLLPAIPVEMMRSGRANDVAMILGMTADDNVGGGAPSSLSTDAWRKALADRFQGHADAIGALYPAGSDEERARSLRQMKIDRGLGAIWAWNAAREASMRKPIHAYLFDHVEPGHDAEKWGAFHSSEIPYQFGTLDKAPERGFTFTDWKVSLTMSELWASFVKTGKPVSADSASWPALDSNDPAMLQIDASSAVMPLLSPAKLKAYRDYVDDGGSLSNF